MHFAIFRQVIDEEIIYLPHNRESDCLDRCLVTKIDLGHYELKKNIQTVAEHVMKLNLIPRTFPRLRS